MLSRTGSSPSQLACLRQVQRPYLAIHVLQPLEPQVGNNSRGAIIYWEDVYPELLGSCCRDLW